jgi:hypothetical protein
VVEHPFFTDRVRFANDRLQHHEVAARLLLIEAEATDRLPDLRAARVDEFVRTGRRLRPGQGRALAARVARTLSSLGAIFGTADPLLARPAAAVLYYALLRHRAMARAETPTARGLRTAIARVQAAPAALDRLPGGDHEASLVELSRLQRRGAMSARDLERQLEILDAALAPSR